MDKEVELIKEAVEYMLGADLVDENGCTQEDIDILNKIKNKKFTVTFK